MCITVSVIRLSIALVLVLPAFGQAEEKSASEKSVFLNPNNAEMVFCTQDWSAWITKELVLETRGFVAPEYTFRCYLQSDPRNLAKLVLTYRDTGLLETVGIRSDGSMVLQDRYMQFLLVKPDGKTVPLDRIHIDGQEWWAVAAYDEGVFMQPEDAVSLAPVYFVPWTGDKLDLDKRLKLTPENVAVYDGPKFFRQGNLIAWSDSQLHTFDIVKKTRRDYPLNFYLVAFDGETAAGYREGNVVAMDVVNGKSLPARLPDLGGGRPHMWGSDVITVKDKFLYVSRAKPAFGKTSYLDRNLVAYDLNQPACAITNSLKFARIQLDRNNFLFATNDYAAVPRKDGLWICEL